MYGAINGLEGVMNADVKGNIVDLTGMNPCSSSITGPRGAEINPHQAQG